MPDSGILATSIHVEQNKVTVDSWAPVLFDSDSGTNDQDFVDLTFD